jgi:hypothetical protein
VSTKSVNERLAFILTSEMDIQTEKIMPSATFQSLGFDSMRQIDFALLVDERSNHPHARQRQGHRSARSQARKTSTSM